MTTFVEAIRRKYEKLTEYTIFETFTQKSNNRIGANILFPAKSLTMDCQQISRIGCEAELIRAAGHVVDLDLSGNKFKSWNEVFILLRCLRHLESLNLSQNPLGPHNSLAESTVVPATRNEEGEDEAEQNLNGEKENSTDCLPNSLSETTQPNCDDISDRPFSTSGVGRTSSTAMDLSSPRNKIHAGAGSPVLRFASYEPVHDTCDSFRLDTFEEDGQLENRENWWHGGTTMDQSEDLLKYAPKTPCPPILSAIEANLLGTTQVFPRLNVLALNATYVPWNWVLELLHRFPNLSTLHVALNNYGAEEDRLDGSGDSFDWHIQTPVYPRLRTLYYSDNGITSWWTVCRLGRLFPGLEHLILLGNPLSHIPAPLPAKQTGTGVKPMDEVAPTVKTSAPLTNSNITGTTTAATATTTINTNTASTNVKLSSSHTPAPTPTPITSTPACPTSPTIWSGRCNRPFGSLHTLGLSETMISRWESVDALGEWMPNMTNLRLGNTLPVFQSWPESECRAHVIARLPNLTTYNRSAIDSEEREAAEREFVRYFGQIEPSLRPNRYWELERQHGRLEPLANIDLSPKRFVRVRVAMGDKEIWHNLNLNLKVGQVKRQLASLFGIDSSELRRFRLLYFDQVMAMAQGPEELKFPNRAIHSYQPESGDMFELIRFPDFSRSG
ncbi:Ormdl protein [Fasciolopsis buskii]|uniref:Ormdl protein n=1 Tax=Fasciolopsis buskii TaxID=27845 RepID=A0A8E0S1X4_9TREM|nr:Ormdl protein [Fasciolopsis buski]